MVSGSTEGRSSLDYLDCVSADLLEPLSNGSVSEKNSTQRIRRNFLRKSANADEAGHGDT